MDVLIQNYIPKFIILNDGATQSAKLFIFVDSLPIVILQKTDCEICAHRSRYYVLTFDI